MRIAYICYWDLRRADGVSDKITAQVARWRTAGHEVELHSLAPGPSRLLGTAKLAARVRSSRPDLVYLRYDLFMPPILWAFGSAALVAEFNSNIGAELARSALSARYERVQRRAIIRRADGAVAVTGELLRELKLDRVGLATEVIANGVEFQPPPAAKPHGAAPRLVYVGEAVYWQGVDKILLLAEAFPDWRFDLVGVESIAVPPNVTLHGFLGREAYTQVLVDADVAIGTLALHRKQMNEASPLKVRRYLEFGLPVILGYVDTDLDPIDAWWLLKLPNGETNVRDATAEIESFVTSAAGRRVPREEVEPVVSTAVKERARLAFFESVVGQRRDS